MLRSKYLRFVSFLRLWSEEENYCSCSVYGLCIHIQIRNQTYGILRSPVKIIFTMFTFSPGEIILEKIFGFKFCSCFVYGSCNGRTSEDAEDL